jgi:hypothetical protein
MFFSDAQTSTSSATGAGCHSSGNLGRITGRNNRCWHIRARHTTWQESVGSELDDADHLFIPENATNGQLLTGAMNKSSSSCDRTDGSRPTRGPATKPPGEIVHHINRSLDKVPCSQSEVMQRRAGAANAQASPRQ